MMARNWAPNGFAANEKWLQNCLGNDGKSWEMMGNDYSG